MRDGSGASVILEQQPEGCGPYSTEEYKYFRNSLKFGLQIFIPSFLSEQQMSEFI